MALLKGRYRRMSLWDLIKSEKIMHSPHRRALKSYNKNQRASFCICFKGSYTLEAAVVIPLLAGYLVTVLFFFSILEIQFAVDEALIYAGKKTAVESSLVDSEELLFLSAEGYLQYTLAENTLIERFVKHGSLGIRLWKSEFSGEEIILRAEYEVMLPISFFEIGKIRMSSQNSFRKWIGNSTTDIAVDEVYVTQTGTVYHNSLSCRSIDLSIETGLIQDVRTLRGKNGQKYYECTRCEWTDKDEERIYYTDYGTLYHKDIACSALKRTVSKIKLEQVGNRRPCSFCYGL